MERRSSRTARQQSSHHSSASSNSTRSHQKSCEDDTIIAEDSVNKESEEDGVVRCICSFDDYPGPPPFGDEDSKHGVRQGIEEPIITDAEVTEELSGFFLQCDICKVWQHGGCVGIMNEEQSPEEYFCEECRKDLHKIFTAPNGQRYSHYLPLYQNYSRPTSRTASFSKDGTRSPRGGRASSSLQSAKRRSTMNSRDAAYDEEEQMRRAIEASKVEKSSESTDGGSRRGKRGRSDSEEKPEGSKRQRTTSASPSPSREQRRLTSQAADSDEGPSVRNGGVKKIRGAAARNHREKELREERERSRLEAKKKREGRAERRRVESEPPEEILPAARSSANKASEVAALPLDPPSSSQVATPETPLPNQPSTWHRKGGRPPNARKGKLGKNQYTKDRDLQQDGDDRSPGRSQSRDVSRNDEIGHMQSARGSTNEVKPSKFKGYGSSKVTMSDMKKRVAAILEFISRTQLEMASEPVSPASGDAAEKLMLGIAESLPMIKVNGSQGDQGGAKDSSNGGQRGETNKVEFKDLSCLEMMDVLTRQLVKWQKEFKD